jgi:hypothetical protein
MALARGLATAAPLSHTVRQKMMRLTRGAVLVLAVSIGLLGLLGSCTERNSKSEGQPSATLTESQRDSTLGASKLPGAKVVGRAIEISDSAEARAKRIDEDQY